MGAVSVLKTDIKMPFATKIQSKLTKKYKVTVENMISRFFLASSSPIHHPFSSYHSTSPESYQRGSQTDCQG